VLAARGEIILCAGLGAIAEPYVIAYTRQHELAVAALGAVARRDLFDALDLCIASGLFPSGTLSVFEHAGRASHSPTACLEHCHLHIIDGSYDLSSELKGHFTDVRDVCLSIDIGWKADEDYLFTGKYRGERVIVGHSVNAPSCGSQFFRRALSAKVKSPAWNWRLSPNVDAARRLCSTWSASLDRSFVRAEPKETHLNI
jgi:hypothetical protein